MQVNISSEFMKAYNVEKVDIIVGTKCFIELVDHTALTQWFSNNDPVLDLKVNGNVSEVQAKEEGRVTLLIMDGSYGVLKTIILNVLPKIDIPAVALSAVVGEPVTK